MTTKESEALAAFGCWLVALESAGQAWQELNKHHAEGLVSIFGEVQVAKYGLVALGALSRLLGNSADTKNIVIPFHDQAMALARGKAGP